MSILNKIRHWYKAYAISKGDFDKKHFLKQYQYKATVELLQIIDKRDGYNPLAVEAAIEEIMMRGLSEADRNDFIQAKIIEIDERKQQKPKQTDIHVVEKIILYCFPFYAFYTTGFLEGNWSNDEVLLKRRIARRYSVMGLIMFCVSFTLCLVLDIEKGWLLFLGGFPIILYADLKCRN